MASRIVNTIAGAPSVPATQLSAGVRRTAQTAMSTTPIWTTPTTARPATFPSRNG